jgi:predicted DNA-binding transcriptional regulator AlpA
MSQVPLLTAADVMTRLAISRATLDALIAAKELPVVDVGAHVQRPDQPRKGARVNRALRFREEDIEAFLAARRQAAVARSKEAAAPEPKASSMRERQPRHRGRLLEMPGALRYAGGHHRA